MVLKRHRRRFFLRFALVALPSRRLPAWVVSAGHWLDADNAIAVGRTGAQPHRAQTSPFTGPRVVGSNCWSNDAPTLKKLSLEWRQRALYRF